jgi:hypothetical protein
MSNNALSYLFLEEAMSRRELIILIGQGAMVWPIAAFAQQGHKSPVVDFLQHNPAGAHS